jgi:succinyl-diaminopimelate desuccinylase
MGDLLALAAELVSVPSVSLQEGPLADLVQRRLAGVPGLEVVRVGDNVVARTLLGRARRVALAGHLDTVPPDGMASARTQGDVLWGPGSTDMKGGLAVMLDLAAGLSAPAMDLTWIFYVAEEIARSHSGLLQLASRRQDLVEADVAIICEPTDGSVEAGCQGVLKASITMAGARAHVSRPWKGVNAVHRLGPVIDTVRGWAGRDAVVDGCKYRESLQVVGVSGGVASNVLPDTASLELNYRFAPDRTLAEAEAYLGALVAGSMEAGDSLVVTDSAPPAPPRLTDPVLAALVARSKAPVVAKLGWTDVAFFAERGVPAANFGPGDPQLAHTTEEHVSRASLECARAVLADLLSSPLP